MENLKDFVKIYNIDDTEFNQFVTDSISSIKDSDWSTHQWYSYDGPVKTENSTELSTYYTKSPQVKKIWREYHHAAIKKYLSEMTYQFPIYYVSDVRYNKYDENTEMKRHNDHIRSLFDGMRKGIPIFSILGAMNPLDEYTGGEFVFDYFNEEIKLEMGQIMVFPSVFMYEHHVNVVTSGKRYTSISWAF